MSVRPDEFNDTISRLFGKKANDNISQATFDIISIMEKPEENKFMDIRIKASSRGILFEFKRNSNEDDADNDSFFGGPSRKVADVLEEEEEFTVEAINKKLCNNLDCPAVKKFKKFGIGPLATGKGLGAVTNVPNLPVTYGLSQTYGTLEQYGPYGLYSRPKRAEEPFVPKRDDDWSKSCWKPKRMKKHDKESENQAIAGACNSCPPLRLTGGGVFDMDDIKSPLHECKEIMDQFDDILDKYKRAIGPCGKVTCPFAPNIVRETCKNTCQHPMDFKLEDLPPCVQQTPVDKSGKRSKRVSLKGACGSPKCAYAKYKTGLTDEDAMMELQYLPPAVSGKCGHPKCPFPIEPDLPPIHWDCPEPLPKGICKNPNCPYLPDDLKCLNEMYPNTHAPCGNPACPYTLPQSCSSPDCPFSSKQCPYEEPQDDLCDNPDCPYASKEDEFCENPNCPYSTPKPKNGPCGNPSCAYEAEEKESLCENPSCPFATSPEPSSCYPPKDTCPSPRCPFSKKPSPCYLPQQSDNSCTFPGCPFATQKPSPCYLPQQNGASCPFDIKSLNPCLQNLLSYCLPAFPMCGKEDCPYAKKEMMQICYGGVPICPAMAAPCGATPPPPPPKDDDETCSNPRCPYMKKGEGDETRSETGSKKKFRQSLAADIEPPEGMIEYSSDTRTNADTTPCRQGTCTDTGGELECDVCTCNGSAGGDGVTKEYRPSLVAEKITDAIGPTEYRSDTRLNVDNSPCTQKTCKSKAGTLECDVCPCSSGKSAKKSKSDTGPGKKTKKTKGQATKSAPNLVKLVKSRKWKSKYVYAIGDKYPGIQIGHKECVIPAFNVPPKMGWLWNIHTPCMQLRVSL